ncbi:uncharacterized protein MELLADRAFT_68901 [Melampsora larici-populina 98AG31]|uniref:Uncharacterized protein n=1 Tax=Melampsora larici-populina (strain 98AG31 / pathotype 3-4-7) TaxID=747676 RepID=F4S8I1_MELLP|nr:uncharacterized protein MELLADRAFT_68901 [Melampsora larici-populina 98AG31]EGF99024.1 hypothetical protein MELLADRAFT_68901 [Melampsora larici-populina 98AG31]
MLDVNVKVILQSNNRMGKDLRIERLILQGHRTWRLGYRFGILILERFKNPKTKPSNNQQNPTEAHQAGVPFSTSITSIVPPPHLFLQNSDFNTLESRSSSSNCFYICYIRTCELSTVATSLERLKSNNPTFDLYKHHLTGSERVKSNNPTFDLYKHHLTGSERVKFNDPTFDLYEHHLTGSERVKLTVLLARNIRNRVVQLLIFTNIIEQYGEINWNLNF